MFHGKVSSSSVTSRLPLSSHSFKVKGWRASRAVSSVSTMTTPCLSAGMGAGARTFNSFTVPSLVTSAAPVAARQQPVEDDAQRVQVVRGPGPVVRSGDARLLLPVHGAETAHVQQALHDVTPMRVPGGSSGISRCFMVSSRWLEGPTSEDLNVAGHETAHVAHSRSSGTGRLGARE